MQVNQRVTTIIVLRCITPSGTTKLIKEAHGIMLLFDDGRFLIQPCFIYVYLGGDRCTGKSLSAEVIEDEAAVGTGGPWVREGAVDTMSN